MKRSGIWIRLMDSKTEVATYQDWAMKATNNLYDPQVAGYPCTEVLVAENGQPLVFMPIQQAVVMDALAPKPGIEKREMALALKELVKMTGFLARQAKLRELYFFSADEDVNAMAERYGFEKVESPMLRLKLVKS
jgi:hypothetical protein